jgi:hypothetical protein
VLIEFKRDWKEKVAFVLTLIFWVFAMLFVFGPCAPTSKAADCGAPVPMPVPAKPTKKLCVCGTSCKCDPGQCPQACPVPPIQGNVQQSIPNSLRVTYQQQWFQDGRGRLFSQWVPVYEQVSNPTTSYPSPCSGCVNGICPVR